MILEGGTHTISHTFIISAELNEFPSLEIIFFDEIMCGRTGLQDVQYLAAAIG